MESGLSEHARAAPWVAAKHQQAGDIPPETWDISAHPNPTEMVARGQPGEGSGLLCPQINHSLRW